MNVTSNKTNLKMKIDARGTDKPLFGVLLFCFVWGLTSRSTAMFMLRRTVHLATLFLGKLYLAVNQYFVHVLSLVTDKHPFYSFFICVCVGGGGVFKQLNYLKKQLFSK